MCVCVYGNKIVCMCVCCLRLCLCLCLCLHLCLCHCWCRSPEQQLAEKERLGHVEAAGERGFDAGALAMGRIWSIYGSMFALLDSRQGTEDRARLAARAADMSVEARCKCSLRADALKLLLRFFKMRLNSRLSCVIHAYEFIFDQIQARGMSGLKALKFATRTTPQGASSPALTLAASVSQEQINVLSGFFSEFEDIFKALEGNAFGRNMVSIPEIGTDLYREHDFKDVTVQVMLDLCTFKNNGISTVGGHRSLCVHISIYIYTYVHVYTSSLPRTMVSFLRCV